MNVRHFLFMGLGLTRALIPENQKDPESIVDKLIEPDACMAYRRNFLALAGIVVVAGFAGAEPQDIAVFGVTPAEGRGVLVLGAAVVLVHLYWYAMRYHHLKEDGTIVQNPIWEGDELRELKISRGRIHLVRKSADLWANSVAVALTALSWYFVASWIFDGPLP